MTLIF
jgi:hypothetical protein